MARRAYLYVLIAGLLLRVFVFFILAPQNTDAHFEIIRHIYLNHALPNSAVYNQSYHPPLYYLLATFFLNFGAFKAVQSFSLILSLATLILFFNLLRRLPWIDDRLKPWCLALPAFHPQFIQYTLFISNDTLAIFLGAAIFDQGWRCLERPTLRHQALLAALLGLGLLTKITFLAFIPPVLLLLIASAARAGIPPRTLALRLAGLILLAALIGGYKFAENTFYFGRPLVNNLDFDPGWARFQRPFWIGPATLLDINLLKLLKFPVISSATIHSAPLLLYGSFWYSFIPDSSFRTNLTDLKWLGSAIYTLACVPTLLMLIGALRCFTNRNLSRIYFVFAVSVLLLNLALVALAGWKYDIWSIFQGRLLFPAYFALVLLLGEGLGWAARRRWLLRVAGAALAGLFFVFAFYYCAEARLAVKMPVPANCLIMPMNPIDMRK